MLYETMKNEPLRLLSVVIALAASGCAKDDGNVTQVTLASRPDGRVTLQGSGASFPAPLYSRWFKEFSDKHQNVRVNYQATGSGAGIKAFLGGQTDFGASDAAMTDDEMREANGNVVLVPVTAGAIVLAYRLEGVENLALSREAYSDIFLGKISNWNDQRIALSNPAVRLPDQRISVVHRSDGSGTTFVFTKHLAEISKEWSAGPGVGTSVDFPVGVGGRKNDGVTALIQQTPGALGYVEYTYALSASLPMAALENKAGKFVSPSVEASAAALASVELPENLRAWVSDPPGEASYPIVSFTWILAKKTYADADRAKGMKDLLSWCLGEGQVVAKDLHYIPLPDAISSKVQRAVAGIR
jgi:phosphate transport system substrate-binding protein